MTRVVLDQHAIDAAGLFAVRLTAVRANATRLDDLARLDARIEAHVDGLRHAGKRGLRVALDALGEDGPGEVFVASLLAATTADRETIGRIIERARPADIAVGLGCALQWLPASTVEAMLEELARSAFSSARVAALVASTAHRRPAPVDVALLDDDPALRAAAFRAVGVSGRRERRAATLTGMLSDEPACRFWSAWSGALLGEPLATTALRVIAESGGPFSLPSAELHALVAHDAAAWVLDLASDAAVGRRAVQAAAALGDPQLLPMLLDRLADPSLARIAADAIARITGLAIAPDLANDAPADHVGGPTDDPDDEDVAMDPDDDLPWPNPTAIHAAIERLELVNGVRHVAGRPLDAGTLRARLTNGRQPERALVAFELALRGAPLFDVDAPAPRQRAALQTIGGAALCGD